MKRRNNTKLTIISSIIVIILLVLGLLPIFSNFNISANIEQIPSQYGYNVPSDSPTNNDFAGNITTVTNTSQPSTNDSQTPTENFSLNNGDTIAVEPGEYSITAQRVNDEDLPCDKITIDKPSRISVSEENSKCKIDVSDSTNYKDDPSGEIAFLAVADYLYNLADNNSSLCEVIQPAQSHVYNLFIKRAYGAVKDTTPINYNKKNGALKDTPKQKSWWENITKPYNDSVKQAKTASSKPTNTNIPPSKATHRGEADYQSTPYIPISQDYKINGYHIVGDKVWKENVGLVGKISQGFDPSTGKQWYMGSGGTDLLYQQALNNFLKSKKNPTLVEGTIKYNPPRLIRSQNGGFEAGYCQAKDPATNLSASDFALFNKLTTFDKSGKPTISTKKLQGIAAPDPSYEWLASRLSTVSAQRGGQIPSIDKANARLMQIYINHPQLEITRQQDSEQYIRDLSSFYLYGKPYSQLGIKKSQVEVDKLIDQAAGQSGNPEVDAKQKIYGGFKTDAPRMPYTQAYLADNNISNDVYAYGAIVAKETKSDLPKVDYLMRKYAREHPGSDLKKIYKGAFKVDDATADRWATIAKSNNKGSTVFERLNSYIPPVGSQTNMYEGKKIQEGRTKVGKTVETITDESGVKRVKIALDAYGQVGKNCNRVALASVCRYLTGNAKIPNKKTPYSQNWADFLNKIERQNGTLGNGKWKMVSKGKLSPEEFSRLVTKSLQTERTPIVSDGSGSSGGHFYALTFNADNGFRVTDDTWRNNQIWSAQTIINNRENTNIKAKVADPLYYYAPNQ